LVLGAFSLGAARQEDDSCNCARRSRSRRLFLLFPQMSMETDGHGGAKVGGPQRASGQEPEWVRGSESFSASLVQSLPPNGTHQRSQCMVSLFPFLSCHGRLSLALGPTRSQVKQPQIHTLFAATSNAPVSKFDKRRRTLGDAATASSALYPQDVCTD
jgi:hypothetical protein